MFIIIEKQPLPLAAEYVRPCVRVYISVYHSRRLSEDITVSTI